MIMLGTMTGIIRDQAGSSAIQHRSRFHHSWFHRAGRGGGLLLAVLLLAGCPGTTDVPTASLPGAAVPTARTPLAIPVPKVKPAPPPALPPVVEGVSSAPPPEAPSDAITQPVRLPDAVSNAVSTAAPGTVPIAVPTAVPTLDPRTIVGLDQVQTRRLLGIPAATEEAPPAKVWRYAKGDCTLEVFFFMDMTSAKDFRALSYDMKSSQNVPDHDNRCFAQLVAQAGNVIHD